MGLSFFYGLQDTFTPFQFANIWMMVLILAYRGTTGRRILGVSFAYIFSVCFAYFCASFGSYDLYYTDKIVVTSVRNVYLIFGVFFLAIGCVSIFDWFRINFTDSQKMILNLPKLLMPADKSVKFCKGELFRVYGVALFSGWFMTFLSMIWQEEFVFDTFSYILSGKDIYFTVGIYCSYFAGQILPFLTVCLIFELLLKIKNFKDVAISTVKIIFAAVGFGLGVNLIILRFI